MNSPGSDNMEDSAVEETSAHASAVRIRKMKALIAEMGEQELVQSLNLLIDRLRRDPVLELPGEVCGQIFEYLDSKDLRKCELVSKRWRAVVHENSVWRHLFFRTLQEQQGWHMLRQRVTEQPNKSIEWKRLYQAFTESLHRVYGNWLRGQYAGRHVHCNADGIYTLQYDDKEIFTGNRDDTIKIWDLETLSLKRSIAGHTGSVLCLQYDDNKIITSSSDHTIRIWDRNDDFKCVAVYTHHEESVLHVRFDNEYMVSCSKDRSVVIWKQTDVKGFKHEILHDLKRHRAAVNVVEFDKRHIVSASGDRTIIVWETGTGKYLKTLQGHERGIACIQYRGNHIVSGSSDQTIRIWQVDTGECINVLRGHTSLVRCVRFDDRFIVSGSYDGTVRVWNFQTGEPAPRLEGHDNRVFRVQFDAFKIVSSSQDDTLRVWDFSRDVTAYCKSRIGELGQQLSDL
ncbi:hypothetical protein PTSG_01223 [Salpingoeca rosetta]|uniref:F-box domain-containing protein n=1 Tax=Salpingoeca rosetta (strain ATCC 50818 / BSB-021) TaxID=946362 RepID=F2U161_SALR5|nr:uncharacterized protein PTSG_01223 [Salpingoeca rosetta]EGD80635.1 hypothetical protein PTSG_01223 [Salpingoeca rosetta]|eukprot:XP_004997196.1 hypothetical protein PTSG_01223 [Salpingoeca rosetta]